MRSLLPLCCGSPACPTGAQFDAEDDNDVEDDEEDEEELGTRWACLPFSCCANAS